MDNNDFGFTLEEDKIQDIQFDKAKEIYQIVIPLIHNLSKDPTKDIIKWPGEQRVKQMNEVIARIHKIMGVKDNG